MFIYLCIMAIAHVIIALNALLSSQSRDKFIMLAISVLLAILYWSFWALGKRFKDSMVYSIPAMHLLTHLIVVGTAQTIQISEGNSAVPVHEMHYRVYDSFAIYTLLLAPTVWHVALLSMPCYLLSTVFFSIQLTENVNWE